MTTLGELLDRARSFTRDADGRFVDDDDFVFWATEAIDDLGARLQLFDHELTDVTTGSLIPIPTVGGVSPILVEILSLNIEGDDHDCTFVDSTTFRLAQDSDSAVTGRYAAVFGDNIETYAEPDVGTAYVLRYKKLPVPMETTDDVVATPRWLDRKIVAYMTAMALMKEKEDGSTFLMVYEQGLPPISNGREKFFTQPLAMTRKPNAFDLQTDARHR